MTHTVSHPFEQMLAALSDNMTDTAEADIEPWHLMRPLLEMLVQAMQPERQPAAARFEERDP